ncbi:MAG: histidine kinase dimerization/phospho-acceptor domain-containing protein [Planctomycetota bacterium]
MRRTPLQIAQRRLRRTRQLLRQREAEFQSQQRAVAAGQLAAGIMHGFNNSLAAILGQADLQLLNPKLDSATRGHAEAIVSAAQRMADTVRQLSAFSRGNASGAACCSVDATLHATVSLLQCALPRAIAISVSHAAASPSGEARIAADTLQFELVQLVLDGCTALRSGGRITLATTITELDAPTARQHGLTSGHWIELDVTFHLVSPPGQARPRSDSALLRQSLLLNQIRGADRLRRTLDMHTGCTVTLWIPKRTGEG